MAPATTSPGKGKARTTTKRKPSTGKRGPATMTSGHKSALAQGREDSRLVRTYLEALEANKPKRGRKVTPESTKAKIDRITAELPRVDAGKRLLLLQERRDLQERLDTFNDSNAVEDAKPGFVRVAKRYADRKGISYAAFREAGVSAEVLKEAGITRSGVALKTAA